jgi:Group XII secretory phospholipase A2 precursor (PLA2G12)
MMQPRYQSRLISFLLITIATSIVEAQFDGFGEAKFCKPYTCPKDQEPVPKWPLKLSSTGCSSMGGMQVFATASDDDDPMRVCCDLRHACLQTCGSLKTFCDEEYIQCGKDVCVDMQDEEAKSKCEKSSSINELMVKMDNCQRYEQQQYTHCECVPKDTVQSKRERVIRAFYKKFNPENIDKVAVLVQKVDTPAKMVGLLLKLYKKYPDVIQKLKDPQQEMMEKIMKENREKEAASGGDKVEGEDDASSDAEDLGVDEL